VLRVQRDADAQRDLDWHAVDFEGELEAVDQLAGLGGHHALRHVADHDGEVVPPGSKYARCRRGALASLMMRCGRVAVVMAESGLTSRAVDVRHQDRGCLPFADAQTNSSRARSDQTIRRPVSWSKGECGPSSASGCSQPPLQHVRRRVGCLTLSPAISRRL
jgi:hypothetical protein